jgi:hypothetical protein
MTEKMSLKDGGKSFKMPESVINIYYVGKQ